VIKPALGTCRSARSALWRPASISVRVHGETKTERPPHSRPARCRRPGAARPAGIPDRGAARGWWRAWLPGCADELHRPGQAGARGGGLAGAEPAGRV